VISFGSPALALGGVRGAFCYAEFAGWWPILQGRPYHLRLTRTVGELLHGFIGWDLILEYAVGKTSHWPFLVRVLQEFLRGFGLGFPGARDRLPDGPQWRKEDGRGGGQRDARVGGRAVQLASQALADAPRLAGVADRLQPPRVPHRGAVHHRSS